MLRAAAAAGVCDADVEVETVDDGLRSLATVPVAVVVALPLFEAIEDAVVVGAALGRALPARELVPYVKKLLVRTPCTW